MREHPILFSALMVRAILEGRKTQTRRIVRLPDAPMHLGEWEPTTVGGDGTFDAKGQPHSEQVAIWHTRTGTCVVSPYGVPGDRLWVRETWGVLYPQHIVDADEPTFYRADYTAEQERDLILPKWRPSIFMRPARSRITLEVTSVRVERLHEITDADARAEGVYPVPFCEEMRPGNEHVEKFKSLWTSINHKRAPWASNPFVWVVEFTRVEAGDADGGDR